MCKYRSGQKKPCNTKIFNYFTGWMDMKIKKTASIQEFFKPQDRNQSTLVRCIKLCSNSLRKMLEPLSVWSV